MRNILGLFFVLFICAGTVKAQGSDAIIYNPNSLPDTTKKSIKSMAVGVINGDSIKITYHSPGVRNRIIWGGLVPFDEVWVTGAHNATLLEIGKPVMVGGQKISAGNYAIFSIPGKDEWTIILNRNWQQHLAWDYAEKDDVVRLKVKPIENKHTERLQYFVDVVSNNTGRIAIAWEKLKVEFPFAISK